MQIYIQKFFENLVWVNEFFLYKTIWEFFVKIKQEIT